MGVTDLDPDRHLAEIPPRFRARYSREIQIYLASILGARDDAALDLRAIDPRRIGLFDGVARPAFEYWYKRSVRGDDNPDDTRTQLLSGLAGQPVGIAASILGIQGPTQSVTATCASGAVAIGTAAMYVQSGQVDVAFAGGHECSLVRPLFQTYEGVGLLTRNPSPQRAVRPYVDHSTNVFGEGAITLVLESERHAVARGATILARIQGFANGNSGQHPTSIDPLAIRASSLMNQVLDHAGVQPANVAFVVGHGNAVRRSDMSELNYMRTVFGSRSTQVPLLSVKPIYGHTLGASSALNIAAAALMVSEDYVVPTINVDPEGQARAVQHMPNEGQARTCDHGLAVSYGMGGQNAVVLVSKKEAA